MDLRTLCSKLDVDAIRAKFPPLPQIKLPKSISKLKSRKIFRSSRENIGPLTRRASSKRIPSNSDNLPLPLRAPGFINRTPNRISTISSLMNQADDDVRVSSKSKLKNSDDEHFYRSAGGIEDYYPSPLNNRFEQRVFRPISPIKAPPITQEFRKQSQQNVKMSLGDRLQKGYKDATDFKLKHLFAKRTVVRTDNIEITEYIQRFDEDRLREERIQERVDRDVADAYRFQFKVSQQNSEESYTNSPNGSPEHNQPRRNHKTVSELSGDESGMESSPPLRKPGIASTRFSRVRHTPLNMSLEDNNDDDDDGIHAIDEESSKINPEQSSDSRYNHQKLKSATDRSKLSNVRHTSLDSSSMEESRDNIDNDSDEESNGVTDDIELNVLDVETPKTTKPNASSLYDIKKYQAPEKPKSIKERMGRFTKQRLDGDEVKQSPQKSQENHADSVEATTTSDKTFEAIKQNFKRLQKSIKLPQQMTTQSGVQSENDETIGENKTVLSKTQQFSERIKRFRSTEQINKNPDDDESKESPIHKIANKLLDWRKSIKKKVDLHNTDKDDDYEAGSPQKPIGSLMKKLKHIRTRKRDSTEDPDDDEEGGETYKESLAARAKLQLEKGVAVASLVPQKTIKRISDTKKYFKKKQESADGNKADKSKSDEEEDEDGGQIKAETKPTVKTIPRPPPPIPRPYFKNSSEEEDSDEKQTFITKSIAESKLIAVPGARAVWTTNPILPDDTADYDDEIPRVLLHQDNSDLFESTLIIAVTRPISRTTSPIITELPPDSTEESTPDTKPDNWIPNQDTVASFLEMTPPSQRRLSKEYKATSISTVHSRKQSIDSSSEDSWIKDIPKGPSTAVQLDSVYESEKPWKVQKRNPEDNLYKTKSIDLFEMQKKYGGVLTAFEDFDDELKNAPIVKIKNEEPQNYKIRPNAEIYYHESSEELENPDDDNSSRVTKISVHPQESKDNESAQMEPELKAQPYGNSRESLAGHLDDKDAIDSEEEDDNEESDEDVNQHSPLKKASSPPSLSATPPPLPQRQLPISPVKLNQLSLDFACPSEPPPPLPLTKPPIPPNRPTPPPEPPKIPNRNATTTRISRPLVKTASLRLEYSEQVNPQDVGKVNKLISRFEPDGVKQRPRILPRKSWTAQESEEYSDEEDSFEIMPPKQKEKLKDVTPTNHPRIQKSFSIDSVDFPNNNEKLNTWAHRQVEVSHSRKDTSQNVLDNSERATPIPIISISSNFLDVNSNFSQPSSVYGSPLAYPSSLDGSTETRDHTPSLTNRKETEYLGTRRNRRSLARDDEHFYSFDSDEENSYYSISSTSSNRYIVEL